MSAIDNALIGGNVHQLPESQLKLNSATDSVESMHRKRFFLLMGESDFYEYKVC